MSEDVLPPAPQGASGDFDPKSEDDKGNADEKKRPMLSRRGAITAIAVGIASIWFPAPMKAWAGIDYFGDMWNWSNYTRGAGEILEDHASRDTEFILLGDFDWVSNTNDHDGNGYGWLSAAPGAAAHCLWWTELYYCLSLRPLVRCQDRYVNEPRYGHSTNHGWVTATDSNRSLHENNVWSGCDFGVAKQDGIDNRGYGYWQCVDYSQCANYWDSHYYHESVDFTTQESGSQPWEVKDLSAVADSGWYYVGDTQYHDHVNKYHQILIRRTSSDRDVNLWSWLDGFSFKKNYYSNHVGQGVAGWPYDGRDKYHCAETGDIYSEASMPLRAQRITTTHTAGLPCINGDTRRVYRLMMQLNGNKALSADGTCQETAGVYVWDYNNETKQNWIISDYDVNDPEHYPADSDGTHKLSAIRCVGSAGQHMCLNQHGGWSDAGYVDWWTYDKTNYDGHPTDVWLYNNDGTMASRWWIFEHDGATYLMNDSSGAKLATVRGATDNGTSCVVFETNCDWSIQRTKWDLVPVQFEGTAALTSTVGAADVAMEGNEVQCSLPFWLVDQYHETVDHPCYPADTFYTNSVHYCYTWYADDVQGAHKNVVVAETQVDDEHHTAHATYTPKAADIGKYLSCRIRLKMDRGYFYEGEVWAEFDKPVLAKKKVVYHVDEAAFPNPISDLSKENEWSDETKAVWVQKTDHPTDTSVPYTARADWTAEAKRDGHDAAHAKCTHADGSDGFDGWYIDSSFKVKFTSYTWKDPTSEETLHLYARNIGHVDFKQGKGSDAAEAYTSDLSSEPVPLDDACGMPASTDYVYGVSTKLPDVKKKDVWYAPTGGSKFDRPLRAEGGWHADEECSGDPFSSLKLLQDTTVYKKWLDSTFDGIESHDAQEG